MKDSNSNKGPRKVHAFHLYYVISICILVMIFVTIVAPVYVTEEAFSNFSFASTITSIVLAVVSIVYSIQSGLSSGEQMANARDIEREIKDQLEKFTSLEDRIGKKVNECFSPLLKEVSNLHDGQIDINKKIDVFQERFAKMPSSDKKNLNEGQFNIEHNSTLGNICLYCCLLSQEKGKPINRSLFYDSDTAYNYVYGHVVALSSAFDDKISCEAPDDSSNFTVKTFDKEYFGDKTKIRNIIISSDSETKSETESFLNKIDEYFNENDSESIV